MTTIQRPNSRPVAATLLAVFLISTAAVGLVRSLKPSTASAGALYPYKADAKWYNGPVAKPVLSGNNMAFVTLWENGGQSQYLYMTDLVTGKDAKITSYPIATNTSIAISANYVAWTNGYKNKWNLFLFDRYSYTSNVVLDTMNELGKPSIDGTKIAWREANYDQTGAQIRIYDHATKEFTTLSSGKWYSDPVVSGNRVAWFETTTSCNNDSYRLCNPDSAKKNLVVYDLTDNTTRVIASDVVSIFAPTMSSTRLVWTAKSAGHYDLYQNELFANVTTRLTNNELDETEPVLANGRIAYLGISSIANSSDVLSVAHVFTIATKQDQAMQYEGVNQSSVTISDDFMAWSETRSDSRIYIYDFNKSATKVDTDRDGLSAAAEQTFGTDPQKKDTDSDGISDTDEIVMFKTNPTATDSDGDGLSDYEELFHYHTDPMSFDTDGDGYNDGLEVKTGHNPKSFSKKLVPAAMFEWTASPR
ncbi:MAG: hypothetical protein NT003_01280 [Candidatus Magasanikbacteria bacterium]|nr:hypothetical protein [Candidatus Magasanikbacteria bacterium]